MSKSLLSVRAAVVGALGAGALSGAMLFGALPMANAAQAPTTPSAPAAGSSTGHVELTGGHHHHHSLHHSVAIL